MENVYTESERYSRLPHFQEANMRLYVHLVAMLSRLIAKTGGFSSPLPTHQAVTFGAAVVQRLEH
jgi:hypothetical protein